MDVVVLLSGGLDSLVTLHLALEEGKSVETITFDYNQRHKVEIAHAEKIAKHYNVRSNLVKIDTSIFMRSKSSLVHQNMKPETNRSLDQISTCGIPSTYVPGRNTLFLSYALSLAESINASEIHVGANASDLAGFPDTRPTYFKAFQGLIDSLHTETPIKLVTPLLQLSKKEIVALCRKKNIPLELSISCYQPIGDAPCLQCDACKILKEAIHA